MGCFGSCRGIHRCDGGLVLVRRAPSRSEGRPMTKTHRVYTCGLCGRKLKPEHYIYSSATGARYCWPGEGCDRAPGNSDSRVARLEASPQQLGENWRQLEASLTTDVELEENGQTSLGI